MKKNSSSEASTSSSGSGSSSGSTSCSDTDSSSSTKSREDVSVNITQSINSKSQANTRRKSSEAATASKSNTISNENEKIAATKSRTASSTAAPNISTSKSDKNEKSVANLSKHIPKSLNLSTSMSSEEDTPAPKKAIRPIASQKRKPSSNGITKPLNAVSNNPKQSQNSASKNSDKKEPSKPLSTENLLKDMSVFSPADVTDEELGIPPPPFNRLRNVSQTTSTSSTAVLKTNTNGSAVKSKPITPVSNMQTNKSIKVQPKRNISSKNSERQGKEKSSESESGSGSDGSDGSDDDDEDDEDDDEEDESSSSSEESSISSNSYASQPTKNTKGKKVPTKTITNNSDTEISENSSKRKQTRSHTRRRRCDKQQQNNVKQTTTPSDSDSDTETNQHSIKRAESNSPGKRTTIKKESGGVQFLNVRSMTPPLNSFEKKCPIEGCDSSGHLSGSLERHFLPEACPIYHNMSASECKERAQERRLREELRLKLKKEIPATSENDNKQSMVHAYKPNLSAEQREFAAKIKASRNNFRPTAAVVSAEKVKKETDCADEDREPSLAGIVPDYDLQLFREAQAIASQKIEEELKEPVGKGIRYITMGKYKMKVWYQSPYPEEAARLPKMFICEFCLKYQKSETSIKRHAQKCVWRHPPGDEIYRKGKLQVWQVDGKRHKVYCQHLCLLAKFFLDHKTLYYDVEPFLFYIMTLADSDGCHTVGYFSKEKNSFYNVSCILTLPPYQRKGYGRLLIDFSYLLTRVEGKIGSPEKPLSDLGLISYRSYWKDVLLDHLCNRSGSTLSIKDVSQEMAIYSYDIVSTLQALGMMKYWKGKHIVLKKQDVLDEYEERVKRRGNFPKIDDSCLRWSPFVPTQHNNSP